MHRNLSKILLRRDLKTDSSCNYSLPDSLAFLSHNLQIRRSVERGRDNLWWKRIALINCFDEIQDIHVGPLTLCRWLDKFDQPGYYTIYYLICIIIVKISKGSKMKPDATGRVQISVKTLNLVEKGELDPQGCTHLTEIQDNIPSSEGCGKCLL